MTETEWFMLSACTANGALMFWWGRRVGLREGIYVSHGAVVHALKAMGLVPARPHGKPPEAPAPS